MTLRLSRIMMALVVGTASLVSALSVESASAVSQTCAWTGTAGDKKFSTAANWSGCGGGAPLAGDIVTIDTDVFADTAAATGLNNDLAVALGGITVTKGTTNTNGVYDVTIDTLSLADGATIATPKNSANELASLVVNTGSARGIVTSTGSITVPGQVYAEYNVTGTATLNSGAYITDESHFGTLKIGDGAMVTLSLATPSLTVDLPYALHFVSSTSTMRFIPYCVAATCDPVTITETHPITLAGNTQLTIDKDVVLNVTGTVTGGTLNKSSQSAGVLNVAGATVTTAAKTTECTNSQPTQTVSVAENETFVIGEGCQRNSTTVYTGGLLKGTNTVDTKLGNLNVYSGATVAPGMSPGCIVSTILTLSGTYQFELGGVDPCTGYDQLQTTDTVNASPVTLGTNSVLATSRYNNYTPTEGQVFTIISVAGTHGVQGTFKDLAEGATFTQNGVVFKVSYVGGDGNDVTLTVQNQPTAPNTGFELLRSNPLVTVMVTTMVVAVLAGLGRKLQLARR